MCVPLQLLPNHRFMNEDAKKPNTSHTQAPAHRSMELSVQMQKPLTDQFPILI